ncbi:Asp-tRNA(Asn)/Glu-tRNA(Gln) amidotransferase subunit GatC [Lagierella sp.]|uniref:Asp-tRNA(Asn)/Glu-tRNA(Gln) amidotransferase subunit GatC n=1 Tax=Lagierella sp. TaxID=2849657 RepID=UPI00261ECDB5|nr:Asp-tRNA(Asn)/Glu-tRNA(Gln) amidotransferase subunit GatC [Lagierella sp.]
MIDKNEVKRIYQLAHLKIQDDELEKMEEKFNKVLEFSSDILKVDTENIDMLEIVENHNSTLRDDVIMDSLDREEALKNATDREYGYFRLKKVIE